MTKKTLLCFTLSMPNVGSWNGKWSGKNNLYCQVRSLPQDRAEAIAKKGYFYYSFGDGWSAGVTAKIVDAKEAARFRKATKGFCGYEWMIDSIESKLGIEVSP